MKRGVYEALWLEWQQDKHIYDPLKILDFYKQLENESNVPKTLMEKIYQAFIARFAQLLSAPFHTDSHASDFPQVTKLLSKLKESPQKYTRDIFETLFDDVLSLESSLSVAQRLGNFNASLEQLAMANLQFVYRSEVLVNSSAHAVLLDNLRQLMKQPAFYLQVGSSLISKVIKLLPSEINLLFIAERLCLRKADNMEYLCECFGPSDICTNQLYNEKSSLGVQRKINGANNSTLFAFHNPHWNNRYLGMHSVKGQKRVNKNLCSQRDIYWWYVEPVQDGVAIYDAATSSFVICGGDPAQWNDYYKYAYTRRAEDFDEHRKDCTWIIEDCRK
ncbi:uncharacterized protein LOC133840061 [Drosophila sulfurigaster albostrigata]|uniref:uncharacterized protein LOC133840061 n=1 Tax=Drosophila sulfurigaster albostrigata TaxID=89887 RepID=UPI002D21C9A2|nr:uncharacterized protein LOC133840061 [Drosophila sulfurigaster albostrigata]